ncbi:MAG: CsiV family protein [Gammaproteobacteria bacterium]
MRRKRSLWRSCAWLLAACLLSTAATGAEPAAYDVEILIFKHENAELADGAPAQPFPRLTGAIDLSETRQGDAFHALPAGEFTLGGAQSVLADSSAYAIIEHVAWRQPGWNEHNARPVHIHGGAQYQSFDNAAGSPRSASELGYPYSESRTATTFEELDGTVKVVLDRYLHVYTDLVFRTPVATQTVQGEGLSSSGNAIYEYRVQDHRRMRSRELHYLDHPLLGVLVRITPVAPAPVQPQPPETGGQDSSGVNGGQTAPPAAPPAAD